LIKTGAAAENKVYCCSRGAGSVVQMGRTLAGSFICIQIQI